MKKFKYIIGIDEAGRGPLAGPIAVAGVCLASRYIISNLFDGIKDSKQLSSLAREKWFRKIKEAKEKRMITYSASFGSAGRIDRIGLSKVVRITIKRILARLEVRPDECLVLLDGGLKAPKEFVFQKTIIGGDETEAVISAAAIVAKVMRDRRMIRYSKSHPHYSFDIHKGYGTKLHYECIEKHGVSDLHRISFLKSMNLKYGKR